MIAFEPRRFYQLYQEKDFDELSRQMLQALDTLRTTPVFQLSVSDAAGLNRFTTTFLSLFVQPDYVIPDSFIPPFISHNLTIANVVLLSAYQTTDAFLSMLQLQPANFVKILTLYSPRCNQRLDSKQFFDADPRLASLWWSQVSEIYRGGFVSDEVCQAMREHLESLDERYVLSAGVEAAFFGVTYVAPDRDSVIKRNINLRAQNVFSPFRAMPEPNPRRIAVVSDCWNEGHSVHRTLAEFVRRLRPDFHVTGIHTQLKAEFDSSLFDEVITLSIQNGVLDVAPLNGKDYAAIYYPDIGMTSPSIMLSNLRLAPLQIMGTGHPVSTWGSEIDWFVGGKLTDKPERPEENYSERLLLLPGYGAVHQLPRYVPSGATKTIDRIVINCPAYAQKINPSLIGVWKRVLDRLQDRAVIRLFAGGVLSSFAGYLPFVSRLRTQLGTQTGIEVVPNLNYQSYMQAMEEGDFACDSFHFGGSNSVADCLHLGKPIVCLEGQNWYNRIGPAMLRDIGLQELIASTEDEYVEKIVRLAEDDDYRSDVTKRLQAADLNADVFSMQYAGGLNDALKFLIDRHLAGDQETLPNPLHWPPAAT